MLFQQQKKKNMDKLEDYLEIVKDNPLPFGIIVIVLVVFLSLFCCCCSPQGSRSKKSKAKSKKNGGNVTKKAQTKASTAYETVKICKYCKVKISDDSTWKSHVVSKKHTKNTDETDKDRCLVSQDDFLTVLPFFYCSIA